MTDEENSLTRVLIDRCKELGIKDLYHLKDLLELAEGRKEKWHDLRKDHNDLPKESDKYLCAWEGGEQWIMDFETEVNSFGYWCNTYDSQSLGFIDSVFETIKERGEDEIIAWCELPKFEE